jgi:hypothetical protein
MTVAEQIDKVITDHPDWRGSLLGEIRRLVREADPQMQEQIKWRGAPTWSHDGLVCVANIFKETVKVVFASGAKLPDPRGMFNSELAGNAWRGITFSENDRISGPAFKSLVRAAVELNRARKAGKTPAGAALGAGAGARRREGDQRARSR